MAARTSWTWRYGAIVFFCGLPLLLLLLILGNLDQISSAHGAADQQSATLSQIVARLATRGEREMTPADAASLYLGSGTLSLARAELQARVTKMTEDSGGRLAEVQLTGTPEQEADGTIAIQLALVIDNKGLLDLLYAIETGLPLLTVADLSARTINAESSGQPGETASLHVDLTVQGHFKKSTG